MDAIIYDATVAPYNAILMATTNAASHAALSERMLRSTSLKNRNQTKENRQ